MRGRRLETVIGVGGTSALLAVLSVRPGLGAAGWIVGSAAGWGTTALVALARRRTQNPQPRPADWVTLTRAILTAGTAGLVADATHTATATLVVLACLALSLDAVDGQVARRTRTATPLGARFDAEVDALLILVLSVEVSRDYGSWVLAIGAARYVFLLATFVVPWLAAPLPRRFWGRFVAAVQGVVLAAAASGVLPHLVGMAAVAVALVILMHSFGGNVVWLYRRGAGRRTQLVVRRSSATIAALVVWAVLLAPDRIDQVTPAAFVGIPLEALVVVAVCLALPRRARRAVALAAGLTFGAMAVIKIFDMAFNAQLDRPFNLVFDWNNLVLGIGVVRDSVGPGMTDELVVLTALGLLALIVSVAAATVRLGEVAAHHRTGAARVVGVLAATWVVSAALSIRIIPTASVASFSTSRLAVAQVSAAAAAISDEHRFTAALHSPDRYARIPATDLLARLHGKDVLLVFVESYGQVAVQGTSFSAGIDTALRDDTTTLRRAGFTARSAFLTSPTFGGMSWIAHSTLQSGLWIDSQQRYDQLMAGNRLTLSSAFGKAGWRTVSDNPADKRPWLQGQAFFHYDKLYSRHDVGYRGPSFSWAAMPDQYTLARFQRHELGRGHPPVMAEIDLVSSHTPWTPLPRMVPWNRVGDGSIYDPMPAQGEAPDVAWQDSATVQRLYAQSIRYSMDALTSWIARLHDNNLVVVLLGDHQPATTVSGYGATHEVPISIVAHNHGIVRRLAAWRWRAGLVPGGSAPVWPMDAFRNRFINTFSTGPDGTHGGPSR